MDRNSGLVLTVLLTVLRSVCNADMDMVMPVGGSAALQAVRLLEFLEEAVDQAHEASIPLPSLAVVAMEEAVTPSSPWRAKTSWPRVKSENVSTPGLHPWMGSVKGCDSLFPYKNNPYKNKLWIRVMLPYLTHDELIIPRMSEVGRFNFFNNLPTRAHTLECAAGDPI